MDAGGGPAGMGRVAKLGSLLLFCAFLFLGCDKNDKDLNPNYKEPIVWGFLSKDSLFGIITYDKEFQVIDYDGLRTVPMVLLNDSQVDLLATSPTEYDYGDSNVIPTYQKYDLQVLHYWGKGFCHVVMPGDFFLSLPPRTHILGKESTLVSAWGASPGAQWYELSIFVNYDYDDSNGAEGNYTFRLDTVVRDTRFSVPPNRVFPSFVNDVIDGDGSVAVIAGYGPAVEPGDIGNVRGNAVGFVDALNEPQEREFYVGSPATIRHAPDGRAALERLKNRLRSQLLTH